MLSQIIQRSWYKYFSAITLVLLPVSALYCSLMVIRRIAYQIGIFKKHKISVPVIIVGNINVGGTGKTPLVIAITRHLMSNGFRPGIVSRGYGGRAKLWPQLVTPESSATDVGDEAIMLATRSDCPVCVGPARAAAAEMLVKNYSCNVIVSDDGLQHLALERDIEIVVLDGERRLGNGLCLPAGPLRELPARLNNVDIVVANGTAHENEYQMQLIASEFVHVNDSQMTEMVADFSGRKVHAIAGIGNNERFFRSLEKMNIDVVRHAYPDHYQYRAEDLNVGSNPTILMTEKDAVKCKQFSLKDSWYLRVHAELNPDFYIKLDDLLRKKVA